MRPLTLTLGLITLACGAAFAADIAPADVLLNMEIEEYGVTAGLRPTQLPDASGGVAMALAVQSAGARGAVKLSPGKYTLLLRVWAPAGDQDGFFVDIRSERDRRVPPGQRAWHAMAYNLAVEKEESVPIAVVAQELGLTVDRIAVVRGTFKTNEARFADLPKPTVTDAHVDPNDLPRMTLPAKLQEPTEPRETGETVIHEDCDGPVKFAQGRHETVPGKFGQALNLGVPDGRYVAELGGANFGAKGTIEFWVRPRPAQRLWWDQGWHYFLHCKPAGEKGFALDLFRRWDTQLRLTASIPGTDTSEFIQLSTSGVDAEKWHHILVSWDMTGERQRLWLLLDGEGTHMFFPQTFAPGSFSRLEIGNTPLDSDRPFLPLDGAIDELSVNAASVEERLAR